MSRQERYHNRLRWDETVERHYRSEFYRVPAVINGTATLSSLETSALGDVRDAVCLHALCHIGTDTVMLARRCRRAYGVDYSPAAVATARRIAADAGLTNTGFLTGDVAHLPLAAATLDVAFLNWGSLIWLLDLAEAVRGLRRVLRPDGRLVVVDQHPVSRVFRRGAPDARGPVHSEGYFGPPRVSLRRHDYAEPGSVMRHAIVTEARHRLDQLLSALSEQFEIRSFSEHPVLGWPGFHGMTAVEDRLWQLSDTPIPLSLVIVARPRPACPRPAVFTRPSTP